MFPFRGTHSPDPGLEATLTPAIDYDDVADLYDSYVAFEEDVPFFAGGGPSRRRPRHPSAGRNVSPVDPPWAQAGIGVQMLALVRILAEYFRLKPTLVEEGRREELDHWVAGALIAAVLAAVSIGLYFFERHGAAVAVSATTVVVLLVYKFRVMP